MTRGRAPTGPRTEARWLSAVPVLLAIEAFAWIVGIGFQDDDLLHFYDLATLGAFRFVLLPHGGHPYALRNAVLVVMRALFDLHAAAYMTCVLLTHLLNVVLCHRIGLRLTRDPHAATAAAALWAVARTSQATLGWYSVYGQVLATTALGALLLLVTRRTDEGRPVDAATVLRSVLLSWAAAFCFGTGMGVALAMPAVLALLAPEVLARRSTRWLLAIGPPGVVALYLVYRALAVHYLGVRIDPLPGSLGVAKMWDWNAVLLWHIVRFGPTELFVPFGDAVSLPLATGGIVIVALVVGVVVRGRRASLPALRRMAALAACTLGAYVVIAVGRGYQRAQAWTVPRYHYMAQFPIALLVAVAASRLTADWPLSWRRGATAACVVTLAVAVWLRGWPQQPATAYTHSRLADLRGAIVAMARTTPPGETAYVRNRRVPQAGWLVGVDSPDFPGLAAFFCILFPDDVVDGRRMRFVETNAAVRAAAAGRPRLAALLVDAAPPGAIVR